MPGPGASVVVGWQLRCGGQAGLQGMFASTHAPSTQAKYSGQPLSSLHGKASAEGAKSSMANPKDLPSQRTLIAAPIRA